MAYESYAIGGLEKGVTTTQMAAAYAAFASGGYYTDSNNITWVNLRLRTNRSFSGNDFWTILHNLPSSNKSVAFTDTNNKYTFKFNSSESTYPGNIIFMDYSSTDLPANEEFTIQFKY